MVLRPVGDSKGKKHRIESTRNQTSSEYLMQRPRLMMRALSIRMRVPECCVCTDMSSSSMPSSISKASSVIASRSALYSACDSEVVQVSWRGGR
eukprot:5312504-Alexandrium_andersonii.AAC.1